MTADLGAESGATLLELTIALSITALVLGMIYGAYTSAVDLVTRWRVQSDVHSKAHLILRDVSRHVRQAREVRRSKGAWVVAPVRGTATRYQVEKGRLMRNGAPLHGQDVQVLHFHLSIQQADEQEEELSLSSPENRAPLVSLRTIVASAYDTVDIETAVQMRQTAPWTQVDASFISTNSF